MIYVSSACLKKDKIDEIIHVYAKNKILNIELSGGTAYYEKLEQDLVELRNHYQLNYAFHAYFPPPKIDFVINLASCNDDIYNRSVSHYEGCIQMMKRIGCKYLSIHAGFLVEIGAEEIGKELKNDIVYNKEEAIERFCKAYSYIARKADDNNISVFLENNVLSKKNYENFDYENYMLVTDYDSFLQMSSRLQFNLLLDLGHLFVSCNTLKIDFMHQVEQFKGKVKWLHVSQNNGTVDEHRPLQNNGIIVRALKGLLAEDNNIDITLETNGTIDEIADSFQLVKRLNGNKL